MKNLFPFLFQRKAADWETGLRAIDLFVPIPLGGDILVTGPAGSGSLVLGHELVDRFLNHPHQSCRVIYFVDANLPDLESRKDELDELLPKLTNRSVVAAVSEQDLQEQLGERNTIVFVASESERFLQTCQDSIRHLRGDTALSSQITLFSLSESMQSRSCDAAIVCSKSLAKQGLYPAIDLSASKSSMINSPAVAEKHRQVSQRATVAIREVTEAMYEGALRDRTWHYNQSPDERIALQALCFLSQSYYTAEVFTGKKATRVPLQQTIAAFEKILAGNLKEVATTHFWYRNELP